MVPRSEGHRPFCLDNRPESLLIYYKVFESLRAPEMERVNSAVVTVVLLGVLFQCYFSGPTSKHIALVHYGSIDASEISIYLCFWRLILAQEDVRITIEILRSRVD
ncbi:hypothetical protein R1flu_017002 [Riccia fluitans]|uniref:Uncharacterized protein n=1 Tax=Riccia fluitans TaxID=41844 RepID=A0ABD1YNY6_9MARC